MFALCTRRKPSNSTQPFHLQEYFPPDCVQTYEVFTLWQRCRCSQIEITEYMQSLLIYQQWMRLCSLSAALTELVSYTFKLSKPAVCQHSPLCSPFEGLMDFPLVSQDFSTSHTNWLPVSWERALFLLSSSSLELAAIGQTLAAEEGPSSETKSEVIPIQATLIAKKCLLKSQKQFAFSRDLKLIFRKNVGVRLSKDKISPVFYFSVKLFHF